MRHYPESESDRKELEEYKAEPWMVECLKVNPGYMGWGVGDDYMRGEPEKADDGGWDSGKRYETWKEFGPWQLDDLNELVHFYFQIGRKSKDCETCERTGYHPDALWVERSWYKHSTPFREPDVLFDMRITEIKKLLGNRGQRGFQAGSFPTEETFAKYKPEFRAFCEEMRKGDGFWHDKITQDEVEALVKEGRLKGPGPRDWSPHGALPAAAEVNAGQGKGLGHDAINEGICVRARCERFGIPVKCPECLGKGYLWDAPAGTLGITLWMLHPRKGASRGIEIRSIEKEELESVYEFLREGARRNAERFEKAVAQLK